MKICYLYMMVCVVDLDVFIVFYELFGLEEICCYENEGGCFILVFMIFSG